MPKLQTYARERITAGIPIIGKFSPGMIWGTAAGAVIGGGISLNIDLLYSAEASMICAAIMVSAILGGLFGHVMALLLSDLNVSYVGHVAADGLHHIIDIPQQTVDLTDYRMLKAQTQKNGIPPQDIRLAIHPVRTVITLPPKKPIHAEARL